MMTIKPEHTDFDFVHREYGPLPFNATVAEQADRYRLVQAAALLRLSREGKIQSLHH
jgi:hypothetical protein